MSWRVFKFAIQALAYTNVVSAALGKRQNGTSITACGSCSFPPRPPRTPTTSLPKPTGWITSTVYTSVTYTITSCPATVTRCPLGSLTTECILLYLTVCPPGTTPPALPIGPTGSGYPSYSDFKIPSGALPLASAKPGGPASNLPESTAKDVSAIATNLPPKPPNATCTGSVCYIQASGASLRDIGIFGLVSVFLVGLIFLL